MNYKGEHSFLDACGLSEGAVVSIVGAGGKTSLMFRLAREVRERGKSCLVTTSTRILIPDDQSCEELDLSATCFPAGHLLPLEFMWLERSCRFQGK